MDRSFDIAVSAILLLAGIALYSLTYGDAFDVPTFGGDVGPAFAPRLFLGAWILFAGIALAQAFQQEATVSGEVNLRQMILVIIIACATAFATIKIGFVFATVPGFALFCWAFQYRRVVPLVVISLVAPIGIWALFTFGFELLLPRSPWFNQF